MKYPYPYIGHGIAAARKYMDCYLCFEKTPNKKEKEWVESLVPEVMSDEFDWEGSVFVFGHNSFLQDVVKSKYDHDDSGGLPSDEAWEKFNQDIDDLVEKVHQKCPVALMLKPIDEEYDTETDEWHDWSMATFPKKVLPLIDKEEGLRDMADHCIWLWAEFMRGKTPKDQKILLDSLSSKEKTLLEEWDCFLKPLDPPPTLKEVENLLPELKSNPTHMRLEDAMEERFPHNSLTQPAYLSVYAGQWLEKKEYQKVIDLAEFILKDGAVNPGDWWGLLVKAYLKTKDVEKAEAAMSHLVGHLEPTEINGAYHLLVCLEYHEYQKNFDLSHLLYHVGKKWFINFSDHVSDEQVKHYSKKLPKKMKDEFAKWLRSWLEKRENFIENNSNIGHWLSWFKRINSTILEDWKKIFEKERIRQKELYQKVAKTSGETQKILVKELLTFKNESDEDQLLNLAWNIGDKDRELAHLLYKHALNIQGRHGYKGQGFLRCANNIIGFAVEIKSKKDKQEALELGLPWGHKNPAIFHNAACLSVQLGRNEEALKYVEYAIKYKFEKVKTLTYTDPDLEAIRKDPRFEKLFEGLVQKNK